MLRVKEDFYCIVSFVIWTVTKRKFTVFCTRKSYINGLVQDGDNSSALAMELPKSSVKPWTCKSMNFKSETQGLLLYPFLFFLNVMLGFLVPGEFDVYFHAVCMSLYTTDIICWFYLMFSEVSRWSQMIRPTSSNQSLFKPCGKSNGKFDLSYGKSNWKTF